MYRLPFFALCVVAITLLPLINGRLRPTPPHPESMKFAEECGKEMNVDFEDLKEEDFVKLRCVGKCVAVKEGYMSEGGEFVFEQVNKKFNSAGEKEAEEILKKCVAVTEEDPCEKIMALHTCIFQNSDFGNQTDHTFLEATRDCMKEKGITKVPKPEEEKEEKFRCLNSCIFQKLGWMNEQGVLDKERAFATLQKHGQDPEVQKCFEQTETEHCALAAEIDDCLEDVLMSKAAEKAATT